MVGKQKTKPKSRRYWFLTILAPSHGEAKIWPLFIGTFADRQMGIIAD
jgi:hypothetical protein